MTGGYISTLALGHHTSPAACDERSRPGARYAGRRIYAAGPVGRDEVLVGAKSGVAIEDGGIPFRCKAVFVRVAADACDAFDGEVEGNNGESCACEEGDEEGAETAVNV